jgi:hypothetical protein
MVALNADDQPGFEPSRGAITDIRIDGLWAADGFTAVRLLSGGSPVKRIHISNIYGTFRCNLISFTHYNLHKGEPRLFEDITIDNIYVARQREAGAKPAKERRQTGERTNTKLSAEELAEDTQPWWENSRKNNPLFWIQDGVTVNNLSISNVARHEWLPDTRPTITIDKDAKVHHLKLRDIMHQNNTDSPLPFMLNNGTIDRLFLDAVVLSDKNGKEKVETIIGEGTVVEMHGSFITEGK